MSAEAVRWIEHDPDSPYRLERTDLSRCEIDYGFCAGMVHFWGGSAVRGLRSPGLMFTLKRDGAHLD